MYGWNISDDTSRDSNTNIGWNIDNNDEPPSPVIKENRDCLASGYFSRYIGFGFGIMKDLANVYNGGDMQEDFISKNFLPRRPVRFS